MSYSPTTWNTGDTITATKLNKIEQGILEASQSSNSSWDAVIRLTHNDTSSNDSHSSLTPSIVSGTFEDLYAKLSTEGCPCILVEYFHPWGIQYAAPMAFAVGWDDYSISLSITGFLAFSPGPVYNLPTLLMWGNSDNLYWNI